MLVENDVPRASEQIGHELGLPSSTIQNALSALTKAGYTTPTHLPQPIETGETPKPRIKPIEDIVKSELKAQESRKRYDLSEKGVVAHINYELGEKGTAKNQKYWAGRGRLVQKAWRLRKNITSMTAFGAPKELVDIERRKLAEVETQLEKKEE